MVDNPSILMILRGKMMTKQWCFVWYPIVGPSRRKKQDLFWWWFTFRSFGGYAGYAIQCYVIVYSTIWYVTLRSCMVWYGTVWYCYIWYSTVRFLERHNTGVGCILHTNYIPILDGEIPYGPIKMKPLWKIIISPLFTGEVNPQLICPWNIPMFSQWSHEICPIAWGNLPMLVESSWNPMIIDITTIPWFVSLWKSPWKVVILDAEIPVEVQNPIKNPLKTH